MPPVEDDFLVRVELEPVVLQQVRHIRVVLLNALGVAVIDGERRRQVRRAAFQRQLVEVGPVNFEFRQVALEKIFVARVERINVAVKKFLRQRLVQRPLQVMVVFQQPGRDEGDARVVRAGLQARGRQGGQGGHVGLARLAAGPDSQRDGRDEQCQGKVSRSVQGG